MHMHDGSMMQMIPYLHFKGGDALWFQAWAPSSKGAIAGACIGLVLLAIFERLLVAVRGVLEAEWDRRAKEAYEDGTRSDCHTDLPTFEKDASSSTSLSPSSSPPSLSASSSPPRSSLPFILEHDLSRGVVFFFQISISYALMLAVMSWNASFIISTLLGLGIGETMFGRFARMSLHH